MRREDAEQSSAATTSVSSRRDYCLYKQHSYQQQSLVAKPQLTFDEWEAAIVKSMSERPDEIIDIFERGRRQRDGDLFAVTFNLSPLVRRRTAIAEPAPAAGKDKPSHSRRKKKK